MHRPILVEGMSITKVVYDILDDDEATIVAVGIDGIVGELIVDEGLHLVLAPGK